MAIDWDTLVLAPCVAAFGGTIQPVFTPAASAPGAAAYAIDGVFDRAYLELIQAPSAVAASAVKPVLGVRLAQFAVLPTQNDLVFVPSVGISYIVREVQADGHGWAKLLLNKVA